MSKIVIGILDKDGDILLVRRRVKEGSLHWQFPGGELEVNESEPAAAEREIFEETDVRCKAITKLGEREHPASKRFISYWLCKFVSGNARVKDEDELDRVEWVPTREVQRRFGTDIFGPVKSYIDSQSTGPITE